MLSLAEIRQLSNSTKIKPAMQIAWQASFHIRSILKVLISLNLIVLLVEPWIDSGCELHIKVEDVDSEGQGEESSDNDHYDFYNMQKCCHFFFSLCYRFK